MISQFIFLKLSAQLMVHHVRSVAVRMCFDYKNLNESAWETSWHETVWRTIMPNDYTGMKCTRFAQLFFVILYLHYL